MSLFQRRYAHIWADERSFRVGDGVVALISDADGTLVDTVELIRRGQYETSKRYFAGIGVLDEKLPTYEQYTPFLNQSVGSGARHTLEHTIRLLYADEPEIIDRVDFDELYRGLDSIQDEIADGIVKPYPGLDEFLMYLGEHHIKLAIFTSGTKHHVVRNFGIALPGLGHTELFRNTAKSSDEQLEIFVAAMKQWYQIPEVVTVTIEDVHEHKPDPEGILTAMRRLGSNSAETVMLGDQSVDMEAAKAANVAERIGITHGFGSSDALRAGGATQIIDSFQKLEQ